MSYMDGQFEFQLPVIAPLKLWYSTFKKCIYSYKGVSVMPKIICMIKFVITLILSVIDYLIFDDNSFKAEGRSKELMSFFNKLFLWCQHMVKNS